MIDTGSGILKITLVEGNFDSTLLSPGIDYTFSFRLKFKESDDGPYGWYFEPVEFLFTNPWEQQQRSAQFLQNTENPVHSEGYDMTSFRHAGDGWMEFEAARLDESAYSVHSIVHPGLPLEEFSQLVAITNAEHSCLPLISHADSKSLSKAVQPFSQSSSKNISKNAGSVLSGYCLYIDMDVPCELHKKVAEAAQREGATCVDRWFIGCNATHVVCEGPSFQRYVGYTSNLVMPLWVLKTTKERFA